MMKRKYRPSLKKRDFYPHVSTKPKTKKSLQRRPKCKPCKFWDRQYVHPLWRGFLSWYAIHQDQFIHPLTPINSNEMAIVGANHALSVRFDGLEIVVCVCFNGCYEELTFASAEPERTPYGYVNATILTEWQTVYFTKQALMECDVFEYLRDWLNHKLTQSPWVAFYADNVGRLWMARLLKEQDPKADTHIPVWSNENPDY
jgi:hypothetical protein